MVWISLPINNARLHLGDQPKPYVLRQTKLISAAGTTLGQRKVLTCMQEAKHAEREKDCLDHAKAEQRRERWILSRR